MATEIDEDNAATKNIVPQLLFIQGLLFSSCIYLYMCVINSQKTLPTM